MSAQAILSGGKAFGWPAVNNFPRQRWITIGRVQRKYIRLGNCGFPNGFVMHWQGRTAWCQEFEFLKFSLLLDHVRMRLGFAGLSLVSAASSVPAGIYIGECDLRVLVERSMFLMDVRKARRSRAKFNAVAVVSLSPTFFQG